MSRKITIVLTVSVTFVILSISFISYKAYAYHKLKNICTDSIKSSHVNPIQVMYNSGTQDQFNALIEKIKKIKGVRDVQHHSKEEEVKEFMNRHTDLPSDTLANLGNENPLLYIVEITIEDFTAINPDEFQDRIRVESKNSGLDVVSYNKSNIDTLQKNLSDIKKASLLKDIGRFITTSNEKYFFNQNYSSYCFIKK